MNAVLPAVLITGVSSGIGHALADWYLNRGYRVYGLSRRQPDDLLAREHFHFASLDLNQFDAIAPTLGRLLTGEASLDLVILNAGILGQFDDLANTPMTDLQHTMDVNVWSNKVLLDQLFADGRNVRQVVAISSGAAVNGGRGWSGYSVSKAALNMLVMLYSREQPKTHFTSFAPGIVDTAMQEQLRSRTPDDRFPSVETLRSKQNTPDMPTPAVAAERLAGAMARLPDLVESGQFTDLRRLGELPG
ncbi:SDR family NAD(P)-dependent oxidoreductase [Lignipirellula cremea]|uniref:Benzil reductase ((S)-benzoin forming) n=1 Tax=Lignipirellula cremea TaxID=2528010 RepID=A0A518E0G7_9BACT|nr:SDR family NAD(P)-dependent oxidoreductase [Lignipirellula cremea]QDU97584.1 Benzil reductase ((S)-benzoin forming) [Lignipirellula cremea]